MAATEVKTGSSERERAGRLTSAGEWALAPYTSLHHLLLFLSKHTEISTKFKQLSLRIGKLKTQNS